MSTYPGFGQRESALLSNRSASSDYVLTQERRGSTRFKPALIAHFNGLIDREPVAIEVADISEGGLFVAFPGHAGVGVGHRCELVLSSETGTPDKPACVDEPIYATVVRTMHVDGDDEPRIGAGLRFDQPIFL